MRYGRRWHSFNVPPKLHNFVLRALWRKLPVAWCIFAFKMTS